MKNVPSGLNNGISGFCSTTAGSVLTFLEASRMSLIVKSTDVSVRGSTASLSALALAAFASSVFLISSRRFMSSAFLSSLVGLATTAG